MLSLDTLISLKETNNNTIAENLEIIRDKTKANVELEAENRVIDKLIMLCSSPAPVETNENISTIEE